MTGRAGPKARKIKTERITPTKEANTPKPTKTPFSQSNNRHDKQKPKQQKKVQFSKIPESPDSKIFKWIHVLHYFIQIYNFCIIGADGLKKLLGTTPDCKSVV